MHAGHLYIISEAAKQADILFVALNSDSSVRRYKGQNKPIIGLEERMHMIAALEWVDFVTWFEEDTPCTLITTIEPNVHVNGAEYGINCVEASAVQEVGAKLHLVDRIPALATSEIVAKILNSSSEK
jgi:rfaE bifunctional protein nucleotidyltransferase chain/domain